MESVASKKLKKPRKYYIKQLSKLEETSHFVYKYFGKCFKVKNDLNYHPNYLFCKRCWKSIIKTESSNFPL